MRDIYYAAVGNPVQGHRLPNTRPTIELAPMASTPGASVSLFHIPNVAALVGTAVLLLYYPLRTPWLHPYDLIICFPVIMIALGLSYTKKSLAVATHPFALLAIGVVCLNHRVSWDIQACVIAISMSVLVYQYGRHAVAVLTCPPVPRADATETRETAAKSLLTLAVLTGGSILAALRHQFPFLSFVAIAFSLSGLLAPSAGDLVKSRWHYFFNSMTSWFTYAPSNLPGLLQSPAGSVFHRGALMILVAELSAVTLVNWTNSPLLQVLDSEAHHQIASIQDTSASAANQFEQFKHSIVAMVLVVVTVVALPVLIPTFLASTITLPVVLTAASTASKSHGLSVTQTILSDIATSTNEIEKNSLFLGRVVSDGMPMFVPRKIFTEHAHGLGDSGSGKTSLFLCPIIEQLAMSGDCSVIVIDLKADTLELLATLTAAAEKLQKQKGISVPVKCFSNQANKPSFAFNPMAQSFWSNFDLQTKTDIMCGANGLTYGPGYGESYFGSANSAVTSHAFKAFPDVQTFEELADRLGHVLNSKSKDLHNEIRKAGVHVQEVIKRLAQCGPLNATKESSSDPLVAEHAIDLSQAFLSPQFLYFHLSATLSPAGAPEIGRLVNYMLLAAATQITRKHQVFLVIDEFQRMVAGNLESMLQLARSMGVGVILANQSMEDLKKSTVNLIPAIESNCRLRQYFSISSSEDRDRIIQNSGETVDIEYGRTSKELTNGEWQHSYSESERVVPRISKNDILTVSDNPYRSILQITRGAGYAQYGGYPVIIQSNFHISKAEYERRRQMPWPSLPGMISPKERAPKKVVPDPTAMRTSTTEVIGAPEPTSDGVTDAAIQDFFDSIQDAAPQSPSQNRGKRS